MIILAPSRTGMARQFSHPAFTDNKNLRYIASSMDRGYLARRGRRDPGISAHLKVLIPDPFRKAGTTLLLTGATMPPGLENNSSCLSARANPTTAINHRTPMF